jgi:RimJ/RimL family protein N-acetyltransferase
MARIREARWPATILTGRLVLRPVEAADISMIARLLTDPKVRKYLGGPVAPDEVARLESACVGATTLFSVERSSDKAAFGLVSIDPYTESDSHAGGDAEVSYQLLPEFWGHGYGRESVAAAVAWAFQNVTPAPPVVIAITQEANRESRRLLEAVGMTQVDRFVEFDAWQVKYSVDSAALRQPADRSASASPAPLIHHRAAGSGRPQPRVPGLGDP